MIDKERGIDRRLIIMKLGLDLCFLDEVLDDGRILPPGTSDPVSRLGVVLCLGSMIPNQGERVLDLVDASE